MINSPIFIGATGELKQSDMRRKFINKQFLFTQLAQFLFQSLKKLKFIAKLTIINYNYLQVWENSYGGT
ncbi:MAG: hypothetical protein KAJ10_11670 [Thermodesulfovibrionia bacterium]|nr:hypothetical protein [Thermodesulfovibrionia bacterium]